MRMFTNNTKGSLSCHVKAKNVIWLHTVESKGWELKDISEMSCVDWPLETLILTMETLFILLNYMHFLLYYFRYYYTFYYPLLFLTIISKFIYKIKQTDVANK